LSSRSAVDLEAEFVAAVLTNHVLKVGVSNGHGDRLTTSCTFTYSGACELPVFYRTLPPQKELTLDMREMVRHFLVSVFDTLELLLLLSGVITQAL
jgi:hypothetical protein